MAASALRIHACKKQYFTLHRKEMKGLPFELVAFYQSFLISIPHWSGLGFAHITFPSKPPVSTTQMQPLMRKVGRLARHTITARLCDSVAVESGTWNPPTCRPLLSVWAGWHPDTRLLPKACAWVRSEIGKSRQGGLGGLSQLPHTVSQYPLSYMVGTRPDLPAS